MKKLAALLLCASLSCTLLSACGETTYEADDPHNPENAATESLSASDTEEDSDQSFSTVKKGKLTVVTSPDFTPYEFYSLDEDNTPTLCGLDIDLAQYIADYSGLDLKVITVDFDEIESIIEDGKADLAMAGMAPTNDRKSYLDFSDVFYKRSQALVILSSRTDELTDEDDKDPFDKLNDEDYHIGAQVSTIQETLAQQYTPDAEIDTYSTLEEVAEALTNEEVDACFIETNAAQYLQTLYPELSIVYDIPYDATGSAIGVAKGNEKLLDFVNQAIAAAIADGSIDQFVAETTDLAAGRTYLGLLNDDGSVPHDIAVTDEDISSDTTESTESSSGSETTEK